MLESLNRDLSVGTVFDDLERMYNMESDFVYEREDAPTEFYVDLVNDIADGASMLYDDLEKLKRSSWAFPNTVFEDQDYGHPSSWTESVFCLFQTPSMGEVIADLDMNNDPPASTYSDLSEYISSDQELVRRKHARALYRTTKKELVDFLPHVFDFMVDYFKLRSTFEIIDGAMQEMEESCKRALATEQLHDQ